MGWPGRIVSVLVGVAAGFVTLVFVAAVLAAFGVVEESPDLPQPSESSASASPSTVSPSVSASEAQAPPSRPPVTDAAPVTSEPEPAETVTETETETTEPEPAQSSDEPEPADVYYANCDEARAAGAAPVLVGEPGYGSHLDRDGDGVACEPYFGQ
ncbi:excalibur calcium-binding domain-containing protein [Streptomyces antibioticus]|uniref:excalibur calcium-binding domain-containing protein n=1 Tax=Streptomyces antibioticus TaxID=1890 RepID=UPI003D75B3DC